MNAVGERVIPLPVIAEQTPQLVARVRPHRARFRNARMLVLGEEHGEPAVYRFVEQTILAGSLSGE
jgi:hypothetical protein